MNEYEQILQKAKKQGLDFSGKNIVVPIAENQFMFNGETLFGKNFGSIMYVLRDVEDPLFENGVKWEPFIYSIVDKYETWISNGSILYRVDFYIVE